MNANIHTTTPNIKTITTECNKRAFEYRMLLASLKKEETVEHVLEIEKLKGCKLSSHPGVCGYANIEIPG